MDSVRTITTPNEVVVSEALATRLFLLSLLGVVALPYLRRKFYIQPLAGDTFLRVGLGGMKVVQERMADGAEIRLRQLVMRLGIAAPDAKTWQGILRQIQWKVDQQKLR